MSLETVVIDGKEYISSARAASLVGYTKDYVGQLARAGKVDATRVGRSWYISEDSIRAHKLNTHYTLTKQKKKSKRENSNTEKTIKNIVKTEKEKIDDEFLKVDFIEKKNDRDIDLFPKIKKNKRDILLHTDIKYEKVNTRKALIQKNIKTKPNHFIDKRFIASTQKKRTKHVFVDEKDNSSRMDGVVKNKYIKSARNNSRVFKNKEDFVIKNNNKTISVIGSIILFTILVLIYIFI